MIQDNEIRAVLIPIHNGQLLLPNASVAEIISYQTPEKQPDSPDWLLGMVAWRQQQVPLICFDGQVGMAPKQIGVRARIAICNALGQNPARPYIAILTQTIPRLVRVSEEVIETDPGFQELGETVIQQVLINGEKAWIPDLDVVESLTKMALSN